MDQVANAIAVIGVYFALMAVLAVLVEAFISWFKIPIPWLQGKPSPSEVLNEVKGWLPAGEKAAALPARIVALNKSLKAIGEVELKEGATVADIAAMVGKATTKFTDQDRQRQAVIRLMAIVLGIGFAALFQIDTMQILAPLLQPAQGMPQATLAGNAHLVGLVLSGLAASAGSSFWHDQSVRLRQVRTATEGIGELTGK